MNVEQTARDFVTSMNDPSAVEAYLTPDAVSAGGAGANRSQSTGDVSSSLR